MKSYMNPTALQLSHAAIKTSYEHTIGSQTLWN